MGRPTLRGYPSLAAGTATVWIFVPLRKQGIATAAVAGFLLATIVDAAIDPIARTLRPPLAKKFRLLAGACTIVRS
jgi:hypothetical protein